MRLKCLLLICGLSVVTVLGGCGKKAVPAKPTVEVVEVEETEEADEVIEEVIEEEPVEEQTEVEDENAGIAVDDVAEGDAILSAYQEILRSAPAIETEDNDELFDAGYGYEENFEKFGEHIDWFAIADINQDGVPELITQSIINFRWLPVSIYTYVDGEAVLLKDPMDEYAHGTFDQCSVANGGYDNYICEENHIHSVWSGTNPMDEPEEDNRAYALEQGELKLVDCAVGENGQTIYFGDIALYNTSENVDSIIK